MKLSTHNHLSILNLQYLLQVGVNNQVHKKKYSRLSNRTNLFCYTSKKIININKEIYNIRKYLNLITSIISKGGSILVNIEKNVYLYKTFRQYKTNVIHNICLLNSLWVNGLLTNHKVILKRSKHAIQKSLYENSSIDTKKILSTEKWTSISKLTYLPQIIFFVSNNKAAIQESKLLNLPYIVVDNNSLQDHLYIIESTQNITWNSYFFTSLIFSIAEKTFYNRYKYFKN